MGNSCSGEEEKLNPTILESLHNAAHAFNIDPLKITFKKNNDQEEAGCATISTITINEQELLKNPMFIDFVTYHEMAHIADYHVIKSIFMGIIEYSKLIFSGLCIKLVSKYISGVPFYIKFITYGGIMFTALNSLTPHNEIIKKQELVANKLACQTLISQGKITAVNAYLAYLMSRKIAGEKRSVSSHPTVRREYNNIYLLLKKNNLLASYNANFTHFIRDNNKTISSISVTGTAKG